MSHTTLNHTTTNLIINDLPAMRITPWLSTPSKNGDYRNLELGLDILPVRMEQFYWYDCHKLQRKR